MMPKGVVALTAIALAFGAAVWAAKPPRTTGKAGEAPAGDTTTTETTAGDRTTGDTAPTFYKDVLPIVQRIARVATGRDKLARFPSSTIRAPVPGPPPSRAPWPQKRCRPGSPIPNTDILIMTAL